MTEMTRMLTTRVSDDVYTKVLRKCADGGCSTYDYLRMLVETDVMDRKEVEGTEVSGYRKVLEQLKGKSNGAANEDAGAKYETEMERHKRLLDELRGKKSS